MTPPAVTAVPRARLDDLYARTDDPWDFRTSPYEIGRMGAVGMALPRARYVSALELGCGNGELARRLVRRCDAYVGLDAAGAALAAARTVLPEVRFVHAFLPCPLPAGDHDLIVVSEVLYFLDEKGIADLARRVRAHRRADVVCVTWLGDTGAGQMRGRDALALFLRGLGRDDVVTYDHGAFRIDVAVPR
ncbi:methyltransferase domain-containing protein [Jannaschia sp. LMIT008]|uniref:methyltransferase domain-containing protein n=1 Tax=Jannaschia maritima TaxID=3032585 RepID=UPI00281252C7|nr:methyltransferase domain-containing protein [Jannaschia sp. LMIT008]